MRQEGSHVGAIAPAPTQRLSIAPGARFHLVVEAQRGVPEKWPDFVVEDVLVPELEEDGIRAWTTSGYGGSDA